MNVELHDYTNEPEWNRIYLMDITVNDERVCLVEDDLFIVDFYDLTSFGGPLYDLDFVKDEMHRIYEAYKMLSDEEFECIKKAKTIKDRFRFQSKDNNIYYPADDAFGCDN